MVFGRILQATRGFSTSAAVRGGHFQQKGVPGAVSYRFILYIYILILNNK